MKNKRVVLVAHDKIVWWQHS